MKSRRNFLKGFFVIISFPVISAFNRTVGKTNSPAPTSTPSPIPSLTPLPKKEEPNTNTPSPTQDIDAVIESIDFKKSHVSLYGFPKGTTAPKDGSLPVGVVKGGPYTGDGSFINLKLPVGGFSQLRYILALTSSNQFNLIDIIKVLTLQVYPYRTSGVYLQKELIEEVSLFGSSNSLEIFTDFGKHNITGYKQYSAFCMQLVYQGQVLRLDQFYLIPPTEPTPPPTGGGSGGGGDNQPPPPETIGSGGMRLTYHTSVSVFRSVKKT